MANGDQCWNWIWQSDEEKCVIGMGTPLREDYKALFHDMRRIKETTKETVGDEMHYRRWTKLT